jgi:hypothetical protein
MRYHHRGAWGTVIVPLALKLLLQPAPAANSDEVLLLSFFRDNGQHGTCLAWSEDGFQFKALNGDKPVFPPANWPGQNLTRDPSVVFHEGRFHMVWTSGWKGRCFGYATSPDLVQWSEPVKVEPFPSTLPAQDQPRNIWAPEICWDPADQSFAIIWSSTTERESRNGDGSSSNGKDGELDHRLYLSRTRDGKHFSDAKIFFDQKFCCIDGQMLFEPQGTAGRWIMVLKNEQEIPLGGKNLRLTFAPAGFSGGWTPVGEPIAGPGSPVQPKEMAEGPTLIQWSGQWFLYWDAFANGHYSLAVSKDLRTWTDRSSDLQMPAHPRHGTVFRAPRSAVGWLASGPARN